jgi:stage III sporulation protein AB
MLKVFGCMLIISACGYLGFFIGNSFNTRVEEIKRLRSSLKMLETEIIYLMNPLPEALLRVGTKIKGPVSFLYEYSSQLLLKKMGTPMDEIWKEAINNLASVSSLKKEELDILEDFGNSLGESDKEEQRKNLQFAQESLKIVERNAEDEKQKYEKMYKTLGVLAGIALALILI